ncbi:MAG: GAF domain-containing protein, partial [Candidatus Eisenbacteria sp.]|nr:GAF domain-containing protein [Candidatus Eisenbacteria bacterium]
METTQTSMTSLDILLRSRPHASEDTAALVRVSSLLNSTLDLKEVLRIAMEEAAGIMNAEASSVLLIDEKTGDLVFEVATGAKGEGTKQIRLKQGEGVAGWVATHNRPVRVDNALDDPRFTSRVDDRTRFVTRSILCVPLTVKKKMVGVIEVINKRDGSAFTEQDQEFLMVLSHQIATGIDNAQLYRRIYEEKETLRAVLDSMSDGVMMVDAEDRIRLHNPAILDLLNSAPGKLSLDLFGDERTRRLVEKMESGGLDSMSFDVDLTSHNEHCTLSNTATLLRGPDGRITGAVLVARNITEAARLEKMKNDFIATTSHKLRTPLTSILSFASLLGKTGIRGSGGDGNEDMVGSAAEAIETQARYLHELIEKLLGFTGMEMGNLQVEKQTVQTPSLIEKALQAVRSRAESRGIEILQETGHPGREVRLDPRKIHLVLTNLLENAIKFSPDHTTVTIEVNDDGDEVCFRITDQGPGIPRDERERIFEKFYQIDRDVTGQVEGAGLGLALCRNIVLAHGGRIEVESEHGSGSTFRVYLPVKPPEGAA